MTFGIIVLLMCGLVVLTAAHHTEFASPVLIKSYDGCKGGVITSPKYPKNYPPNQYVMWKIKVPEPSRIKLTMTHFDVESEATCKYDYLKMDGIDPPEKRYCGDFSKHKNSLDLVFLSVSPDVDIFFHSDDLVQKTGFRIKFKPEICCMNPCGPHGLCKPKPYTKTCEFSCCLKHKYQKKCEKPKIIEPSPPVFHGEEVKLICNSSHGDDGSHTYVWKKNGQVIPGENSRILRFLASSLKDTDKYVCLVLLADSSSVPSDPIDVDVQPVVKPLKPSVDGKTNLTDGDHTTLHCVSPSPVSPAQYEWYKNGVLLLGKIVKTLDLSVSLPDDGSRYWCKIKVEGEPSDPSDSVMLKVIPKRPSIKFLPDNEMLHGESFQVRCIDQSNVLHPVYMFFINGVSQGLSYSNILDQQADIHNIHSYSCAVSADGGVDFSLRSTIIKPIVLTVVRPHEPCVEGKTNLTDGDSTVLTCLSLHPGLSWEYEWYLNGKLLPDQTAQSLHLYDVKLSQDGHRYWCKIKAGQTISDPSDPVTLTVISKKPFIKILSDQTLEDGDSFELQCISPSQGVNNALYVFYINNEELPPSPIKMLQQTANIHNIKSYKCKISVDGGKHFSVPSDPIKPTVRPKEPMVTGDPTHTDGDTTTLTCHTSSSAKHFRWYHNGVLILGETSRTLIVKMDLAKDGSNFTCTVALDQFSEPSDPSDPLEMSVIPKTPTIQLIPKEMEDGAPYEVRCISQSSDGRQLLYVFTVGGKDLPPSHSNILLQNADINNINTYTCKVSADGGESYSEPSKPATPIVCPHPRCWPLCKVGLTYEYQYGNPSGCRICECKPCPSVHCPTNCPTDRVIHETDPNGCKKCSCYPYHCKDPVCPKCPEGVDWEYDDHGCKLCVCKKTCKEPICPQCPYGTTWKYYDNGCKYCACKRGHYHFDGDDE